MPKSYGKKKTVLDLLIYFNYLSHHFVKGPDNFLLKKNFSPKIKCIIMDNIKIKVFY